VSGAFVLTLAMIGLRVATIGNPHRCSCRQPIAVNP
jgi:hypothetical protein